MYNHVYVYIYIHGILGANVTLVKAGDNLVSELSSHMFTFAGLNGVCEICHFCSVLVGERSNPVRL